MKHLHYLDDFLLLVNSTDELHNQRLAFQNKFVLNFTYELTNNK